MAHRHEYGLKGLLIWFSNGLFIASLIEHGMGNSAA